MSGVILESGRRCGKKTAYERELLVMAAKAAGWKVVRWTDDGTALLLEGVERPFNALHENPHSDCMGDAARLAILLGLRVGSDGQSVYPSIECWRPHYQAPRVFVMEMGDPDKAWRTAFVQVAADIGRAMP